jgi:hypothetical protein
MSYVPWVDTVRIDTLRIDTVRVDTIRIDSLLYALLSVNLLIQEIYLAYQIIPSTVS